MRKEGLGNAERYVRHGRLVLIDNQLTLGYSVRMDKREGKGKVRDTKIVLVTPHEIEIVEFGVNGPKIHQPTEVDEGYKSTGIFINSQRKLVTASDYVFDLQRVNTAYGAKNLVLGVSSPNPDLSAEIVDLEGRNVNFLANHLAVLAAPEQVVFQG